MLATFGAHVSQRSRAVLSSRLAKPSRCTAPRVLARLSSTLDEGQAAAMLKLPPGMESYSSVYALQDTYDQVLTHPELFPPHIRRAHSLLTRERANRQRFVDQTPIEAGRNALFMARKVVYVIVARHDSRMQLCATRFSCAQDFVERASRASTARLRGDNRWLTVQGFDNLILLILESLDSERISYRQLAGPRLTYWADLLQDYSQGLDAYSSGDGQNAKGVT
eukprot:5594657-Amphidinium_carterae.1